MVRTGLERKHTKHAKRNLFCYNNHMGSGQGKSRRGQVVSPRLEAQASTRTPVPAAQRRNHLAVFQEQKWAEFLKKSDLEGTTIIKYYLGSVPKTLVEADYEKMITELFADAVTVGAILLPVQYRHPAPYTVEDFVFTVSPDDLGTTTLAIRFKDKTLWKPIARFNVNSYLKGVLMPVATYTLSEVARGVNQLFHGYA